MPKNRPSNACLPIAALLALLAQSVLAVSAQTADRQVTTVIVADAIRNVSPPPATYFTDAKPWILEFPLAASAFPPGAALEELALRLVETESERLPGGRIAAAMDGQAQDFAAFSLTTGVQSADPVRLVPNLDPTTGLRLPEGFPLTGFPQSAGTKLAVRLSGLSRTWQGPSAAHTASRPRLLLSFRLPGVPAPFQTTGPTGTLGPKAFVPDVRPVGFTTREVIATGMRSHRPVVSGGLVHVVTGDSAAASLVALDPLYGTQIWSVPLGKAGQHLLVTPETGVIQIMGESGVHKLQLDRSDPSRTPVRIAGTAQGPFAINGLLLDATRPPVSGPDGALFLATGTDLVGIGPGLQELWRVTPANDFSAPAIGPSGRFVYIVDTLGDLYAIETATGESRGPARLGGAKTKTGTPVKLGSAGATTLEVPVVIRAQSGRGAAFEERIYVSLSSAESGAFAVFSNPLAAGGTLAAVAAVPGKFGQPVPDAAPPVEGQGGETKVIVSQLGPASGQPALVLSDWVDISSTPDADPTREAAAPGSLVLDAKRNAIVLSGKTLFAGPADASLPGAPLDGADNVIEPRLFFGGDGALYLRDANPQTLGLRLVMPVMDLGDATAFCSPGHAVFRGSGREDATLRAAQSMILTPGSTLAAGTTLSLGAC